MTETERILTYLEDEESRFIYQKRAEYNKTGNFDFIREIVDKYLPQFKNKPYHPGSESEIPELLKDRKNILVFGCGANGKSVWDFLASHGIKIESLVDNDSNKWGYNVWGDEIRCPGEIDYTKIDAVVVTPYERRYVEQIHNQLSDYGLNKKALVINYRDYDTMAVAGRQYFDSGIIRLQENEVFVDGGALNLSTSIRFAEECRKNKVRSFKIHAFEPDSVSYQRSLKIQKTIPDIDLELYCAGLWSKDTTLHFEATGNGSACITQQETSAAITAVALDNCISDQVTLIKMDIEGAELEALKGSREIIKAYKPKLAICVYHKKEDLIEIPAYIKELVPEYKLYIRHYSNAEYETVLYAVMQSEKAGKD